MKSHYDTLGIEKSADARQIKRAYFEKVKQFPPERCPDEFKEIRAAYDALSDEQTRTKYDEAAALPEEVAFLYGQAQKAQEQWRNDQVAEIYGIIVKSHPELAGMREQYAKKLEAIGKTGKAIEVWEKLCSQEPDNARYVISLADCYEMRGWRKKAINTYARAIKIDDGNIECWASLVDCHASGFEYNDVARISIQAVDALKRNNKESIYIYSYAAVFGALGDETLTEGFLKDIVRMAHTDGSDEKEILGAILLLLNLFIAIDSMHLFKYIREMADALTSMDDGVRTLLDQAEQNYIIDELENNGFSGLFCDLFSTLEKKCDCEDCRLDIAAMECNILAEIEAFRPQLLRLKNEFPPLFAKHSAFFNEAILTRNPDKLMHQRLKLLSKHGFYPSFLSGDDDDEDDDEAPVQQTVRRDGPKVGRNDPCPCGSGKKFKKCCGA